MSTIASSFAQGSPFLPHGYCIAWDPPLALLHVASDGLITLAYYSIPLTLLYLLARRPLRRYRWVVGMFAAFILACGTTHLMSIVTLWEPAYWTEGAIKAATAVISLATAAMIWPLVPQLAALPLPSELDAVNSELRSRIVEHQRLEERFRRVVDATPAALVIVDEDGRIVRINEQTVRWFGYTHSELSGQPVEVLVPERFRAEHPAHRAHYTAAPAVRPMGTGRELFARRKDGSEFPVDISLSPVQTGDGLQVISAITDMTAHKAVQGELEQANRRLEAVNQELESFAYSVSHDLRAPLRAMTGFSQILAEDYAARLDAAGTDYLHRIRGAAERMSALIDDLLALSRVTRGELHREAVDLSALAGRVVQELRDADPERVVDVQIAPDLTAYADARMLRILMENLLSNAWKFTARSQQARIEVGCRQDEDGPSFYVRDNGAGFDMAFADKLFGAFQRLHNVQEYPGTGIGLATAQRIAQRHGGRIWAEGTPGAGATFSFTLG